MADNSSMHIYDDITQTIGNTPLVRLSKIERKYDLKSKLVAKLEFFNPLSSVKDRIGVSMINDMEENGVISKGSSIVEATSGNTGIALAFVCASRGYKLTLVMPDSMSIERRKMFLILGAELVLTPAADGMKGALAKTQEISDNTGAVIPKQFANPSNPKIHEKTTAKEIWNDTNGEVSAVVCGVGTGGTITGVGNALKSKNKNIKMIAVEPKDSPMLSEGTAGPHKIQGIGAGFIPEILNKDIIDTVITSSNEEAFAMAREIAKTEGIPCGISSGAIVHSAIEAIKNPSLDLDNEDNIIVAILPSQAERYLSSALFDDIEV